MDFANQETITNGYLAEICMNATRRDRRKLVFDKICEMLNVDGSIPQLEKQLSESARLFCLAFNYRWDAVRRFRQTLEIRFADWLQQYVILHSPDTTNGKGCGRGRGRPRKSYEELAESTRKRRGRELRRTRTSDELQELQLAARLSSPPQPSSSSPFCIYRAIALSLDLDLSELKYKLLRSVVNATHKDYFPSLYSLNQAKNTLLSAHMNVSETMAEVDIGRLLKITTESILKMVNPNEGSELLLIFKWGFDGSGGHSQYKQKFENEGSTDEYLFLVAMVPLKLVVAGTETVLCANERPSSTFYCRPIKFIFQKENATLVRSEEKYINDRLSRLDDIEVTSPKGLQFLLKLEMHFTMIDGSITNTLSNTNAASNCYICGAKSKEMNRIYLVTRSANTDHYRFGLSTLHCWIRFFECLLHIGYRLPIKTWQVRGNEHKALVDSNKKRIQAEFKSQMGLLVDRPKQGFGSTNDGNTARRFFYNPEISSRITGVDCALMKIFSIILRVLASGVDIDSDKFRTLLGETKSIYLELYPWYYMPSSVHKVLIHGCDVIDSFHLPIGSLSEEALEARHKEVRRNRLSHTRKVSRIGSNTDLMRVLLLTSNPFLASLKTPKTNKKVQMDANVRYYLKETRSNQTFPIAAFDLDELDLENNDDSD